MVFTLIYANPPGNPINVSCTNNKLILLHKLRRMLKDNFLSTFNPPNGTVKEFRLAALIQLNHNLKSDKWNSR